MRLANKVALPFLVLLPIFAFVSGVWYGRVAALSTVSRSARSPAVETRSAALKSDQPAIPSTEDFKTYYASDLGITFRYPSALHIIFQNEESLALSFASQTYPYVTISAKRTDLSVYRSCGEPEFDPRNAPVFDLRRGKVCVNKGPRKSYNGITFETYLLGCGNDCGFTYYQSVGVPYVEAKTLNAGAGMRQYYDPILSSLRYINP
jgi:hypothetical protein